ncbi:MAG: helix-turn-helix domain-containing protein [Firmicutes bacterium]|nr:helix-turn-helix domain-containing protein [[Eubacterium] siraeum]MCM1486825.1 helix-turn-helix domain-containing protein [Bacillota bacterium]
MNDYKELRAEISKQKVLRGMTNKDLAEATHLGKSTIDGFMGGKRYSDLVANRLCDLLDIPKELAEI